MHLSRSILLCGLLAALLTLAPSALAQSGACCNLATGACTLNAGGGAADCLCGTTYKGDGSVCSPSPCQQGACCTLAVVCTISSQAQCPLASTFMGAGSVCSPNPCPTGACCNATTGACTLSVTAAVCAVGTTFQGAGSVCAPNPCGGSCCNSSTLACTTVLSTCAGGTFTLHGVCSPTPCGGSCCITATGVCTLVLASGNCSSGTFTAGSACSSTTCGGACCANTGACSIASTSTGCFSYQGLGSACTSGLCGTQGTCCNSTGTCSLNLQATCTGTAGNVWIGAAACASFFTDCGIGACCDATGACSFTYPTACMAVGSSFTTDQSLMGYCQSPASPCWGACCNSVTGACTQTTAANCSVTTSTFSAAPSLCSSSGAVSNPCARTGACCNGSTCTVSTSAGCTVGIWSDGGLCPASNGPCGTGACCVSSGPCSVVAFSACTGIYLGNAVACPTNCFIESEPNDTKAAPSALPVMVAGDVFAGYSLSTAGAEQDYLTITPAAAAAGIYKYTLTYASPTTGHAYSIRGKNSADGVANYRNDPLMVIGDAAAQSGSAAAPLKWYGFGASEQVIVKVTGNGPSGTVPQSSTPSAYRFTLTSTAVTPTDIGSVAGGLVTITTVGQPSTTVDTALWVFDSTFHPIPGCGNDDIPNATNHAVTQSQLSYEFLTPGVYYMALCNSSLVVPLASPAPPLERKTTNNVSDSNTVLCSSSTATAVTLNYAITDGNGATTARTASKTGAFEVVWIKFTIAAPATGACCKPDGSCVIASALGCTSSVTTGGVVVAGHGGTFTAGAACASVVCPQPIPGTCCHLDGTCTITSAAACTDYALAWTAGSTCAARACPATVSTGPFVFNTAHVNLSGVAAGVFVDVTAGPDPILVTRIDYYTGATTYSTAPLNANGTILTPLHMIVYARDGGGSYAGNEFASFGCAPAYGSNWVVNTDTGRTIPSPGLFTLIPVTLTTPVAVPAGSTQAFYLAPQVGGIDVYNAGPSSFAGFGGVGMTSAEGRSNAGTSPGWNTALSTVQNTFNGRIYYTTTGACCTSGACTVTTPTACAGAFSGLSSVCSPNPCPPPAGVCCRGTTCNTTVAPAACTAPAPIGAVYVTSGGNTCNAASNIAPCCYADFNHNGSLAVQDIFDFLNAWFAGSPFAKVGGNGTSGTLAVADIFDFLNAWFAGGC